MNRSTLRASFLFITPALLASFVACGDDTATGGTGGTGDTTATSASSGASKASSSASGAGSTSSASGAGSTSSASSGAGSTTAGSSVSTTAAATTTASSSASGLAMCMNVPVNSVSNALCAPVGTLALSLDDEVECTSEDFSVWPVKVYALDVGEADCVHVRVTNAVGATMVSDLFAAVIDPDGGNYIFEDDIDCIPGNGDGFCPDGGLTIPTAGTAYIAVGSYSGAGSPGCPAMGSTDYTIRVSVNGTDIDIGTAPVCVSDVNVLVQ